MTIPLSALTVPNGKIAIAADFPGMDEPVVARCDPAMVPDYLAEIEKGFGLSASDRRDQDKQRELRGMVVAGFIEAAAMQAAGHADASYAADVADSLLLWLVLNDYAKADKNRRLISHILRRGGQACITVKWDGKKVWAVMITDDFAGVSEAMDEAMAAIPADATEYTTVPLGGYDPDDDDDSSLH